MGFTERKRQTVRKTFSWIQKRLGERHRDTEKQTADRLTCTNERERASMGFKRKREREREWREIHIHTEQASQCRHNEGHNIFTIIDFEP